MATVAKAQAYQNFIGGKWVDSSSGTTFENLNPATGEVIGIYPRSDAKDVAAAANGAKVTPRGNRRSVGKDGSKAILFGFEFDRDVFIQKVTVFGPAGLDLRLESGNGLKGRIERTLEIQRPEGDGMEFPAGRYSLGFTGTVSGLSFTTSCLFTVK